jgi:hypothetical protein
LTVHKDGWLKLEYGYSLKGSADYAGITFTYPENLVTGAVLLADGPYRVWKNRLKGTQFGFFEKNTITRLPDSRGISGIQRILLRFLRR